MKTRIIKIALFLAIVAGVAAYYLLGSGGNDTVAAIRTTGIVEAREFTLSSKVAGRLVRVNVSEGDHVEEGEAAAEVESVELRAELERSKASTGISTAMLDDSRAEVRMARSALELAVSEAKTADALVAEAAASLELSEKDLARMTTLFDKGVVSRSELDHAQAGHELAIAALSGAKASHASAISNIALSESTLDKASKSVDTSKARVNETQSATRVVEARLGDTLILSPAEAVVEYRALEPGEVVAPGAPILTLIDPSDMWVRFDIDERDVHSVKVGTKLDVTLEHLPGRSFDGEIFDIGREASFATERDVSRGRQDIRTFRIRARFDDPDGILKPGMTVMVGVK